MSILSFAKRVTSRGADTKEEAKKPAAKTAKAKKEKVSEKKEETTQAIPVSALDIQLIPIVSEKSMTQQMSGNTYAFRIPMDAAKRDVAKAVSAQYKVDAKSVKTMTVRPKHRRRGRTEGTTSAWKKAYVTLPEGKSIEVA